ncbi:AAA family ATPase [Kallotenue papyrolyticum]|uniref:AAA family ATPase n=1 Tax=Kallotenue papyrolyticum TaxID=1325125 RepID=UPI0004786758|nr:response regulator [Kallotenue papyrolyticum]
MAEHEDKIRVIIADDVAETREILEKALYFERDITVVAKAANGREAVQLCKQHQPDVVLMDINMPELDGIAATEAIVAQVPGTQVIIMSVQSEQEYLRRAMLAGAREYLIKPPDTDELVRSIRHVYKLRGQVPRAVIGGAIEGPDGRSDQGKVVAVFSPKGGVGCTVVAANLAVALKQITSKRVALVDGNLVFGDIGVAMNIVANKTIVDLASRVHDLDAQLINDVTVPHNSQVRVLLAPPDSQSGEAITPDQLRAVLEGLRQQFDYIVVDTQSAYDDRTLTILDVADRVIVLLTLELTTIKNVKQFIELAGPLGYPDDKLMLVLNKADSRLGIRAESIEGQMRHKVAAQIGNAPYDVTLALNQGVPLVIDRRNHPVARDLLALAALTASALTPVESAATPAAKAKPATPAESKGLFGRLLAKR